MDSLVDSDHGRMLGVTFPGNSTVDMSWHDIPSPGPGQVLIRTSASAICGSDLRNAYLQRLDRGRRTYTGCIGGHEIAGRVAAVGGGVHGLSVGDLVIVYHVAGCGQCLDCLTGYMIHCTSSVRTAYGNQRDGGHAPYVLAEATTCIPAPANFSGVDAALIGCGFGTAYEGLQRIGTDGRDSALVVGLGPVGLAVAMVARAFGVSRVVGAEVSEGRRRWALSLGIFDDVVAPSEAAFDTSGRGEFTVSVDASGSPQGRRLALGALRTWGRCAFIGEGKDVSFDVSQELLHKEITLSGSWVSSVPNMAACARLLGARDMHPETVVEYRLPLSEAARGYELAVGQATGKICFVMED